MSQQSYFIMVSQWRNAELLWRESGGWLAVHDRPIGPLDDSMVLAQFGDEAFRRRDELLASGGHWYEPKIAQLVSRRVVQRLEAAGWVMEIDRSMSDFEDIFRAVKEGRKMSVRLPEQDRWSLAFVAGGRVRGTDSLAQVEAWLLEEGAE